jgi:hypothetical protein
MLCHLFLPCVCVCVCSASGRFEVEENAGWYSCGVSRFGPNAQIMLVTPPFSFGNIPGLLLDFLRRGHFL